MARRRRLPEDDRLLDSAQAAERVGMHPRRWWSYAGRYPALVAGRRRPRVADESSRGRGYRWLLSSVIEHMHFEVPRE